MPNSTIAVLGECGVTQVKTKSAKGQLLVQNTVISFTRIQQGDFISLTDIAKVKNADEPKDVVKNWLRSRSTIDFLGLWEQINNPNFKGVEFDSFKSRRYQQLYLVPQQMDRGNGCYWHPQHCRAHWWHLRSPRYRI